MLFILALGLFFRFSSIAQTENCKESSAAGVVTCLRALEKATQGPQIPCPQCAQDTEKNRCEERYKRLFRDGTINVTIAWGYTDFAGTTNDRIWGQYKNAVMVSRLISPCPSTYQLASLSNYAGTTEEVNAVKKDRDNLKCQESTSYSHSCGFQRTDDPEILEKTITINNKKTLVKIRVLDAVLSSSDKTNRESRTRLIQDKFCRELKSPLIESCIDQHTPPKFPASRLVQSCRAGDHHRYQICRSDYVRKAWSDSIKNGDEIVMYNGHARDGGGPSFDPPKVLTNGKIDYQWYRTHREGHKQEVAAFKEAHAKGRAPVIYASHSCNSHLHFMRKGHFPSASPTTAYVMSSRTSFADEGVAGVLATIDSSLARRCGREFNKFIQGASCAFGSYNF
jgi:hypothetical protein